MGCIRVDKISEYLCDPLARALKDDDPYVRKTAAICVAKLYDISNELVESRGFIEVLQVRSVLFLLLRLCVFSLYVGLFGIFIDKLLFTFRR